MKEEKKKQERHKMWHRTAIERKGLEQEKTCKLDETAFSSYEKKPSLITHYHIW